MKPLIEKLYVLKERLFLGAFKFSAPDIDIDEERSFRTISKAIEDAYEMGFTDALNAVEDALQAILADYELEELRNAEQS